VLIIEKSMVKKYRIVYNGKGIEICRIFNPNSLGGQSFGKSHSNIQSKGWSWKNDNEY